MNRIVSSALLRVALVAAAAGAAVAGLTGCGVANSVAPATSNSVAQVQGQVFAGRNYMAGSTVKLYETQSTGVATSGVYVGTAKLLATTTASSLGTFTFSNVTCSSPDMVYMTAEGGEPYPSGKSFSVGIPNNPNSLMLVAVGDCSLLSQSPLTVIMNEATTVAAVYALQPFISLSGTTVNITSSATNYAGTSGMGTTSSAAGLKHAFQLSYNIADYVTANFWQYLGGQSSGGVVPVQELNSLAYMQYLCTIGSDSTAGDFSYCTTLFGLAPDASGTAPTNTLQAMLNIARIPQQNASSLFNFSRNPVPYTGGAAGIGQIINAGVYIPALSSTPNDWSVAIFYPKSYGATSTAQGLTYPLYLALDANDNVYVSNNNAASSGASNVVAISNSGSVMWASTTDSSLVTNMQGIAVDSLSHVFAVSNSTTSTKSLVREIDAATGSVIQDIVSPSLSLVHVAVDKSNNVWYSSNTASTNALRELVYSSSGYTAATFSNPPVSGQTLQQVAIDQNQNIWVMGQSTSNPILYVFPNTGSTTAPVYASAFKSATLAGTNGIGVAIDSSGNAYAGANASSGSGSLYKVTPAGSGSSMTLTSSTLGTNASTTGEYAMVDGAGSFWYTDNASGSNVYRFVPGFSINLGYKPCYNAATNASGNSNTVATCATSPLGTKIDISVDSSGNVWVPSASTGQVVQIVGAASPVWPLKAVSKPGVMP